MKHEKNPSYYRKGNDWLLTTSGCSVLDYCVKFGYYPIAIKIMGLDADNKEQIQSTLKADNELKQLYVKYSKNPSANERKGSGRNWTEYFQYMISGWVLEDLVMEMFRRQGIDIRHNGKDFKRVIDIGREVSQESDCVVTVGGVTRKVELSNELNTFLKNEGYIEKRAPAIYNLWSNKAIWLYRELKSGKYIIVDFATEKVTSHIRYHETWKKDVNRYVLEENGKKVRDDRLIAAELISVVGCGIEEKEQPELTEVIDTDCPPHEWGKCGHRDKHRNERKEKVEEVKEKPAEPVVKETPIKANPVAAPKPELQTEPDPVPQEEQYEYDISDNSDDGMTDWNAVAALNADTIDF